jgi:hypothetical protein
MVLYHTELTVIAMEAHKVTRILSTTFTFRKVKKTVPALGG